MNSRKRKVKAIILCGGEATRQRPVTLGVPKSLLCIYDKPLCYFPISVAMLAGIKDILIICTSYAKPMFEHLLGDGSKVGVNISFAIQDKANGIAEAFIIGKDFIGDDDVCLILGDNIFYGAGLTKQLKDTVKHLLTNEDSSSFIFTYHVKEEEAKRFGIVEFDDEGKCISIEEKPQVPKSQEASVGLYFYTNDVIDKALKLTPSKRGELEITDINKSYLNENRLVAIPFNRGTCWCDSGEFDSLLDACNFVATIERMQGLQIACLEEIAYKNKWITKEQLLEIGNSMKNNSYGKYILNLIRE